MLQPLTELPPGPRLPRAVQGAWLYADEHRLLERCRRRYGDVFTLNMWPYRRLVVVCDPGEVARIFRGDPAHLHAGEAHAVLEPLVGHRSLFRLDEAEHAERRRLLMPALHGDRVRAHADLIRRLADAEIDAWPIGSAFAIHQSMQRIAMRVIIRAIFGYDERRAVEVEERLVPLVRLGMRLLVAATLRRPLGGRGPWARLEQARQNLDELLLAEIARARAAASPAPDVLSLLASRTGLPDTEIRDELVALLIAGHETTATTISWTIERIVRHPAVHARVVYDLAHGSDAYLDCVIKETQRVRPAISFVVRRLKAPMEMKGYTVAPENTVAASIGLVHRRADLYPQPGEFRPERFADGVPEPWRWLPFGGGARRCAGASFTGFEMREVLARVLSRVTLRAPDQRPERAVRRGVTFVPARGARVVVQERRSSSGS